MSDQAQGPGWWVASDGKWYPPETHPDYVPPPPPPTADPGSSPPKRQRRRLWVGIAVAAAVVIGAAVIGAVRAEDDGGDAPAAERREDPPDEDGTTSSTSPTTAEEPRQELTTESGVSSGVDSIGTRYTSAGALITNPNRTWAAYDVSVVFNLLDPSGEVLDTDTTNVPYIPPQATVPAAPLQIGFDLATPPQTVRVDLSYDLEEDRGWAGVDRFTMSKGIELTVSNAQVRADRFNNELSFTASNPGSEVAEYSTWSCVLRSGGAIVGGQHSSITDPIVPGGTVHVGGRLAVPALTAEEVICRAYG